MKPSLDERPNDVCRLMAVLFARSINSTWSMTAVVISSPRRLVTRRLWGLPATMRGDYLVGDPSQRL